MITAQQIQLASVRVRLRCDFEPIVEYARAHFEPLLAGDDTGGLSDVDAELRWHEGHPPDDVAAAYPEVRNGERLDRDLYAGADSLVWLRVDDLRDLHLRFHWDGQRLAVRGDFYHRLSKNRRADRLRRLVYRGQMDALRRKRFTRLLYYVVYYPVFWFLEHVRDAHPIHAAAVHTPNGGVVLAGPSGVGKSTLTAALGASEGALILSDTFVAHRGTQIWAVAEPLLLDRWSIQWLGDAAASLVGLRHNYALGRDGYAIPRARFTERTDAVAVVLPRRAPEPFVRRISSATAQARIEAYNDIVNDLRRYRPLAAVLDLIAPSGLARGRVRALEELTAVPCYEIGLTSSLSRAAIVETLRSMGHGKDQLRIAANVGATR